MPKYTRGGEMIEGRAILCVFKARPSFGIEKENGRKTVTITGNPAVAIVQKVWRYKGQL